MNLTREAQDKPEGINWNTVNGVLFALFLIVGLYGVYWEYTVHGNMILPEAASEHGKKIDQMFNITLILTTIVFILTHILLFAFAYFYKYTRKRKAYYYPHNNTIRADLDNCSGIGFNSIGIDGFSYLEIYFLQNRRSE